MVIMDESRGGHKTNTTQIFSISDLLRMLQIYNFIYLFCFEKIRISTKKDIQKI